MNKHPIKRYLTLTLVLCFILCAASIFASAPNPTPTPTPTPNIDGTLSNLYKSIVNVQKQLSVTLENYFYSLVDDSITKPTASSLTVYSNQLDQINTRLAALSKLELTRSQRIKLDVLQASIMNLKSITERTSRLLNPATSMQEQYLLLNSLIYAHNINNQLLGFFDSN